MGRDGASPHVTTAAPGAGNAGSREGLTPSTAATSPSLPADFHHRLFVWLSPSFPVGAFAYSHGLEMAAERTLLTNRATLETWLSVLIKQGSLHNDLLLLASAHSHATAHDGAALAETNALALALQPSAERYLETTQQGGSFLLAIASAWPEPSIVPLRDQLQDAVAYPVAVGLVSAVHGISRLPLLQAFAFAFVTNLTSAAIRLSLIGQTDAQAIIAALTPDLMTAAHDAMAGSLDDLGNAAFSADLCSLEHETQYSRLFRS